MQLAHFGLRTTVPALKGPYLTFDVWV